MKFETRKDEEIYKLKQELKLWQSNYSGLMEGRFLSCVKCGSMFIRGTRVAPTKDTQLKHLRCPS